MKKHSSTLNAYHLVKEASLKTLGALGLQPWGILGKDKTIETIKDQWLPGVWGEG